MSGPFVRWSGLCARAGTFRLGPLSGSFGPGIWRLVGPNGSGKSTFLRLLAGASAPAAGGVELPGGRPDREPDARADVGFVPAPAELPDLLTAGEAWRMVGGLRGGAAVDGDGRLRALGVDPAMSLGACSVGQRKKAELVAGLAGEPGILLLDEPFAPLDAPARAVVARWLEGWRGARVIVLVEHGELPLLPDGELDLAGP